MPVTRVFLSLGSNLGDRLECLRAAVAALGRGPRMKVIGASKVYETVPVEVAEEQPDYLNCVVELECGVGAIECLRYCQGVEAALGRERKGEKAARTLDIDVLLFGEEEIEEPDFLVPHAWGHARLQPQGARGSGPGSVYSGTRQGQGSTGERQTWRNPDVRGG